MNYDLDSKFVSLGTVESLRKQAEIEGELDHFIFVFHNSTKFKKYACPKCNETGYFKVGFLGKLVHPDCGWGGYMDTGSYFLYQLKSSYMAGIMLLVQLQDQEKKMPGIIGIIFSLWFGLIIRLPIGIILTLINGIINVTQKNK